MSRDLSLQNGPDLLLQWDFLSHSPLPQPQITEKDVLDFLPVATEHDSDFWTSSTGDGVTLDGAPRKTLDPLDNLEYDVFARLGVFPDLDYADSNMGRARNLNPFSWAPMGSTTAAPMFHAPVADAIGFDDTLGLVSAPSTGNFCSVAESDSLGVSAASNSDSIFMRDAIFSFTPTGDFVSAPSTGEPCSVAASDPLGVSSASNSDSISMRDGMVSLAPTGSIAPTNAAAADSDNSICPAVDFDNWVGVPQQRFPSHGPVRNVGTTGRRTKSSSAGKQQYSTARRATAGARTKASRVSKTSTSVSSAGVQAKKVAKSDSLPPERNPACYLFYEKNHCPISDLMKEAGDRLTFDILCSSGLSKLSRRENAEEADQALAEVHQERHKDQNALPFDEATQKVWQENFTHISTITRTLARRSRTSIKDSLEPLVDEFVPAPEVNKINILTQTVFTSGEIERGAVAYYKDVLSQMAFLHSEPLVSIPGDMPIICGKMFDSACLIECVKAMALDPRFGAVHSRDNAARFSKSILQQLIAYVALILFRIFQERAEANGLSPKFFVERYLPDYEMLLQLIKDFDATDAPFRRVFCATSRHLPASQLTMNTDNQKISCSPMDTSPAATSPDSPDDPCQVRIPRVPIYTRPSLLASPPPAPAAPTPDVNPFSATADFDALGHVNSHYHSLRRAYEANILRGAHEEASAALTAEASKLAATTAELLDERPAYHSEVSQWDKEELALREGVARLRTRIEHIDERIQYWAAQRDDMDGRASAVEALLNAATRSASRREAAMRRAKTSFLKTKSSAIALKKPLGALVAAIKAGIHGLNDDVEIGSASESSDPIETGSEGSVDTDSIHSS
uniref:Uncharacterized protein n=1 Tax=Mycena chlorophos TaxID=658473 RepID=A0ABQ0LUL3_MYCCL|nr:predicted protein [Mycena chlorophos]